MSRRKKAEPEIQFTIDDLFADEDLDVPAPAPEPPPLEPEPEPEPSPTVEPPPAPPGEPRHPLGLKETIPPRPPYVADWREQEVRPNGGLYTLDCGHCNFGTEAEHAAAMAEGFCCHSGKRKMSIHWQMLRGPYLRPLPVAARRTREKTEDKNPFRGFPGYCCDDEGWYIGGLGNDCRHYRPPGAPLCTAHRPYVPPPPEPDPEPWDPDETTDPPTTSAPSGKTSWKARQMAARRKK